MILPETTYQVEMTTIVNGRTGVPKDFHEKHEMDDQIWTTAYEYYRTINSKKHDQFYELLANKQIEVDDIFADEILNNS